MSQLNTGDWPIDPTITSGDELADKLNRLSAATLSTFAGTSKPADAKAGMIWTDIVGSNYYLMMYNGSTSSEICRNIGGTITYTNVYTKSQVDSKITAVQNSINAIETVPKGVIVMWSGSTSNIPSGWRLCNGSNGTPNLRDRFVVGAGSAYNPGNTGGNNSITAVPKHSHTFSATTNSAGSHGHGGSVTVKSGGSHTHQVQQTNAGGSGDNNRRIVDYNGGSPNYKTSSAGSHSHSATLSINSAGTHSHSVSGTTASSGNSSVDIRPKYYALCFIMKT